MSTNRNKNQKVVSLEEAEASLRKAYQQALYARLLNKSKADKEPQCEDEEDCVSSITLEGDDAEKWLNFTSFVLPSIAFHEQRPRPDQRYYTCLFDTCTGRRLTFSSKSTFIRHVMTIHRAFIPLNGSFLRPKSFVSDTLLACTKCRQEFDRLDQLTAHTRRFLGKSCIRASKKPASISTFKSSSVVSIADSDNDDNDKQILMTNVAHVTTEVVKLQNSHKDVEVQVNFQDFDVKILENRVLNFSGIRSKESGSSTTLINEFEIKEKHQEHDDDNNSRESYQQQKECGELSRSFSQFSVRSDENEGFTKSQNSSIVLAINTDNEIETNNDTKLKENDSESECLRKPENEI